MLSPLCALFGGIFSFCAAVAPVPAEPRTNAAVLEGAREQIGRTLYYDGRYETIGYPNGDVPIERGVCTDVVIRALRHTGEDLQQKIHLDMRANFSRYPALWGLKTTDRNIDHRRVPNIRVYLSRHHQSLPVTRQPENYLPGDIVSWVLPDGRPHIGVVSNEKNFTGTPLIVHNVGRGARQDDMLFTWEVTGHYRYFSR